MNIVREPSPPSWSPNGSITIPAGAGITGSSIPAVQLFGDRRGRKTVVIVNTGANPCTLVPSQQFVGNGVTIAAGGTWAIDTEGAIWVRSTSGTSLDALETFFPAIGDPGPIPDLTAVTMR